MEGIVKQITILTATYNREKKIIDTYNSLVSQKNKNFIWLVIDDGSTDNTANLFEKLILENKIDIMYYKKNNGGKHSAINFGLEKVLTKFVYLSLDSDDILFSETTIDEIYTELEKLNKDEVGIITLCTTDKNGNKEDNRFLRKYDLDDLKSLSLADAYRENLMDAECRMILKTEYVKSFKYPIIKNEKFFTEAYMYWQMDQKVNWTNLNTCYSQYLSDGLSANSFKLYIENPSSWFLYNELRFQNTLKKFMKLKYGIHYIAFGIMSRNKIFKAGKNRILLSLLYPFGIAEILYIKKRGEIK